MTEGKKWMQNLPAFPVALEQTFQSSCIFAFKRLQKFFFCYGKQTISSLLRLSSLFQKEHTTSVGKYVHQFRFSFISCLPLRFFLFLVDWCDCRYRKRRQKKYDASLAHILELFRQAHPEIQLFELPVHGKRPNQKIKDTFDFLLDYLHDRYSRLPAALSFIL